MRQIYDFSKKNQTKNKEDCFWHVFLPEGKGDGVGKEKSADSEGLHNAESGNTDGKDVGFVGKEN